MGKFKNAVARLGVGAAQPPPPPRDPIPVTLISQPSCVMSQVQWSGTSFDQLKELYYLEFYQLQLQSSHLRDGEHKAFFLRDKEFQVAYEGFGIEDIYPDAVIEVCEWHMSLDNLIESMIPDAGGDENGESVTSEAEREEIVRKSKWRNVVAPNIQRINEMGHHDAGGEGTSTTTDSASSTPAGDKPAGGPRRVGDKGPGHTWREKMWVTMDDPSSSRAAMLFTVFMLILILFSTTTFCLETLHKNYKMEPSQSSFWYVSEAACISCFTLELLLRLAVCPNISKYLKEWLNIIDIIAVLPFYLETVLVTVKLPGLAVLRVVRLVRVLRLFKMSRGSIVVFAQTMKESMKPLYMLIMLSSIAVIVASSLMWFVERGWYDEERKVWMRLEMYECEALVVRDYAMDNTSMVYSGVKDWPCRFTVPQPDGLPALIPPLNPGRDPAVRHVAQFTCPYQFPKRANCTKRYEQSPFESIPATTWWAFVTMTTVGYGDIGPTSWLGKLLGMLIMLFGVLVIALPITVIGSNFSQVYQKVQAQKDGKDDPGGGGGKFGKVVPHGGKPGKGAASGKWGGAPGKGGGATPGKGDPNMMLMAALQAAQMQAAQRSGATPQSGANAFASLAMAAKGQKPGGAQGIQGPAMMQLASALAKANANGGGRGAPPGLMGAVLQASAAGGGRGKIANLNAIGKSPAKASASFGGVSSAGGQGSGGGGMTSGAQRGKLALKRSVMSGAASAGGMLAVTPGGGT